MDDICALVVELKCEDKSASEEAHNHMLFSPMG